jgi:hypothetical protein
MFNQQSYNQKLSRMSKRRENFYQLNKKLRELYRAHNKLEKQLQYQALVIEDLNERLNELEEAASAAKVGILAKTVAKVRSVFK